MDDHNSGNASVARSESPPLLAPVSASPLSVLAQIIANVSSFAISWKAIGVVVDLLKAEKIPWHVGLGAIVVIAIPTEAAPFLKRILLKK